MTEAATTSRRALSPDGSGGAPAESERKPTKLAHIRALDGLRGVAVLAVVLYHFSPGIAPGGFLGVDVFFVLSGFLITSLLVTEFERSRTLALGSFWIRRARRLLPALFTVLAVVGLWIVFFAQPVQGQHVAVDGLSAFAYVANWHFIASGQPYLAQFVNKTPSPLLHTWSLAIEEQFYLLWPPIVLGVGALIVGRGKRARHGLRRFRLALVAVSLLLALASLVRMITLYDPGRDPSRIYYGTDSRAFVLLIGAALGALTAGVPVLPGRRVRALAVAAGVAAAVVLGVAMRFATLTSSWLYRGGYGVLAVVMAIVLAGAAQPGWNPLRRLLETRPLVGLGLISYGVYLWHWPAVVWLTQASTGTSGAALFALRAAMTLSASLASYYLVEMPIRRGHLPRWPRAVPAFAPAALVSCVAALLLVPALALPSFATAPSTTVSRQTTEAATAAYVVAPRCDAPPANAVSLATPTRPFRVQLIGNSFANEVSSCLTTIVQARGGTLHRDVWSGDAMCTLNDLIRRQVANPQTRPSVAVLFELPLPNPQYPCPHAGTFDAELPSLIKMWRAAGVHVLLVPDVPTPGHTTIDGTMTFYRIQAQENPSTVTVVDSSQFLRDSSGKAQWRMPCVAPTEVGCAPNDTIGVRFPGDGGLHFCADPDWIAHGSICSDQFAGGERRVAAAIAVSIVETSPARAR